MRRTTMTNTLRTTVLLAALALAAGCGDETGSQPEEDTSPGGGDEAMIVLPDFDVVLTASALSGNAPLEVDFTMEIVGDDLSDGTLRYRWYVNDNLEGEEESLSFPFYRAGSATVRIEVEYRNANGDSKVADASEVIRILGCADLAVSTVTIESPTEIAPGDELVIKRGEMSNEGDRIETGFDVALVLSLNETYEPGEDIEVVRWSEAGMPSAFGGGESVIDYAGRSATVDAETPEGNYFVFFVADPDGVVNECQENNNVSRSTNNLTLDATAALKPDVTISEVDIQGGPTVSQGDGIQYIFRISNLGEGDALLFRHAFWLSTDQTLDPETDIPMTLPSDEGSKVQSMPPNGTLKFFKSFTIPDDLPDGQYWVIGTVDPEEQLFEEDETNNVAVSATPFVMEFEVPTCFDLGFADLDVTPLSTYWGGSVQITASVHNLGTEPTPDDWTLRAFLSQQATLNPSAARLAGDWELDAIGPGDTVDFDVVVPISSELPVLDHFVGVILDPDNELTECEESNNASLVTDPIMISPVASVDVKVNPVVYHPTTVNAGDPVKLEYNLQNSGSTGATAFNLAFVLSEDPIITRASALAGEDIVIATKTVSSVPAGGTVPRIDDVTIPVSLDNTVDTYYLGVIADLEGVLAQDQMAANNIQVAADLLTVVGAQGGCYEDELEPNDSQTNASVLTAGTTGDLGNCGNEDWYSITIPAGNSVYVDVLAEPILSTLEVADALTVELYDPGANLIDTGLSVDGTYAVRAFSAPLGGDYLLRVAGESAVVRAQYAVEVEIRPPSAGSDVLAYQASAVPAALYPGGLTNITWREVNLGQTAYGAHTVRLWASQDTTLDIGTDLVLADVPAPGLAGLGQEDFSYDLVVPNTVPGGEWYFLIEVDADSLITEDNEANNVTWTPRVFLDASLVCADDSFEPNDAVTLATPVTLSNGADGDALIDDVVVCPELDDWYAVELTEGQALEMQVNYEYEAIKGAIGIELWDTTQTAMLMTLTSSNDPELTLPWAWRTGTYYIRVKSVAQGANQGPYTYDLVVEVSDGDAVYECAADTFEDNNSFETAREGSCGEQTATLCNVDLDYYVVDVEAGQLVEFTMDNAGAQTRMRLYSSANGTQVGTRNGNGTLSYTALETGQAYLRVEPKSGPLSMTAYPYTLTIEGISGIDLAVTDLSIVTSTVIAGEDLLAEWSLVNGCTLDASAFAARAWLSQDETLDAADVPMVSISLPSLTAADAIDFSEKITVPASTTPGDYFVIIEADANQQVVESNETNNTLAAPITVDDVCMPDAMEPNDFLGTTVLAPAVTPPGVTGLSLCPADVDWFAVSVGAGQTLSAAIRFAHADGDLDLKLYDVNSSLAQPVASATSSDDDEELVRTAAVATTYLIRVSGFGGASADYDLEIDLQ